MVFCTYCGQSFTRDEHLERHILTHTNVKPFKCFTCHMSFARRDLLQRHYTVHGRDQNQQEIPPANGIIPKSAGRTPIACNNCAKTKTKCDKKFPCSRCAGRNLRCTLRPTRRAAKTVARIGAPPEGAIATISSTKNSSHQQAQHPSIGSPKKQLLMSIPASPRDTKTNAPSEQIFASAVDAAPMPYAHQLTHEPSPPASISPPIPVSGIDYIHSTPLSAYNDFSHKADDSSGISCSSNFMLDWSQIPIQMPVEYDGILDAHMILNSDPAFDPPLALTPSDHSLLPIFPEVANSMTSLMTPEESSHIERSLSNLDIRQSKPAFPLPRHNSMPSMNSALLAYTHSDACVELPAIVLAQDAWSVFKCTPTIPSTACPRTARLNLERLEETLRNCEGWNTWSPQWTEDDSSGGDHLIIMQLHGSTRDKLLAITQSFLYKALEIHRESHNYDSPGSVHHTPSPGSASNFVLLPPSRVLEYFLRSYSNCFERYYPLTSRGVLDANELLHCYNDRAASLLVLMMIAQGAMNIPSTAARMLTGGLTEVCRISLFDLIERNIIMSADPVVLHAALLFTVQAAWSGDKWQMDIAMGQRGMYFAMIRHSGILDRVFSALGTASQQATVDHLWLEWIRNEARSRLIYSWALVDQDLALFHDTVPLFSVTEFGAPLPDADRLWQAKDATEWSSIFEQVHEFSGGYSSAGSGARPLSLRDLFRRFLDEETVPLGVELTPLHLRLLLHPLQSLVCQFSQLLSCFSDSLQKGKSDKPRRVSASSTRSRLQEVQSLLQRWFDLAETYVKADPTCPMMHSNLVIFHLISLNAVTNFPEIERLARRENFDGTYQQLVWMHKRCIRDVEEAIFHCGQVFRLIRLIPRSIRPPWWAGAIYRVALVLWTDSLTHHETWSPNRTDVFQAPGASFAIDALTAEHPLIVRYLTKREGVPCVTKRDGSQMSLDRAYPVLQHCIEVINDGTSSRFSDGIRSKLDKLARG